MNSSQHHENRHGGGDHDHQHGGGGHDHQAGGHEPDAAAMMTPEFWEDFYTASDAVWSGNPNPQLVANVGDLSPGTALDVGSGEGADAIWLAERGWQVTGLDISTVALDRAARRAALSGNQIADRITWRPADLLTWDPTASPSVVGVYDLVSAQFMHLPRPVLQSLHRRLAATVAPGGTLLIVGHHPMDVATSTGRPAAPDMFYTAEEVAAELDPEHWQIVIADAPGRSATNPNGPSMMIRDAVMKAVRRS